MNSASSGCAKITMTRGRVSAGVVSLIAYHIPARWWINVQRFRVWRQSTAGRERYGRATSAHTRQHTSDAGAAARVRPVRTVIAPIFPRAIYFRNGSRVLWKLVCYMILEEPAMAVDARQFRSVMGRFATGVTV